MLYLSYHAIQDVWFYLLVAFVLEALAVYSWQYRKSPGALPLAGVLLNRSVWLISLVIVAISADYESKLFWVRIQQVTASLPPVLWLVFMLQMAYRWRWGNWRILAGLLFVPAIAWLLLFTNQWHGCYWSLVRFENGVLTFQRGFGNLLMVAYNFFLLPFILYYTAQWIRHCRGFRRWQVVIIVVAQLSGSVGTFLWAFTQQTGMVSPLPLSSLIAGLAWVYGFFYLRVLNRLALAQITAMEIMGNCLAVVDTEDWIVDLNAAGADTLGITPAQAVGKQAAAVFGSWPGLDKLLAKENSVTQEVCLETNAGIKYYEFHIVILPDQSEEILGKAFVWKEITEQKQAQLRLLEQEKALSILAERKRIGREIHDGRGQIGGYLQMELQTIQALLEKEQPEKAKAQVEKLRMMAKEFNIDVRDTIEELKMGTSVDQDFLEILQEYLNEYKKKHGIGAELIIPSQPWALRLDFATEVQLLRIIQEALNNVRKHAKASRVKVSIQSTAGETRVCVADDGQGFDMDASLPGKNHYGLDIMRERANEAGGEFRIESKPGEGTTVTVKFSLRRVETNEDIVGG